MKRVSLLPHILAVVLLAAGSITISSGQPTTAIPLDKGSYRVLFSPELGIPLKVDWMLRASDLGAVKREPSFKFKTDKDTPRPRVASALYTRSGYQRGHMCPAADRSATTALMRSTFIMSNICPMTQRLNTGKWKMTEDYARKVARTYGSCSIIAAPLFYPEDTTWIGGHRVAVPHAFFKILFSIDPVKVHGMYVYENR